MSYIPHLLSNPNTFFINFHLNLQLMADDVAAHSPEKSHQQSNSNKMQ